MGKGNRNSQQKKEQLLANEEKLIAKENAKKSKQKKDKLVATACIVVALLIVVVLVLSVLNDAGVFIRATNAMFIEGNSDVTVNGAMMTYFISDAYESKVNEFYEQYYYYILMGNMGVNLSANLSSQVISSTAAGYLGDKSLVGKTWYDYFMDSAMKTAIENVEMYVTYANAGKNIDACDLDDEQLAEIKLSVKNLKKSLKESGLSIADQYGKGVSESDIRACLELMYKANNYAEYLNDVKDKEFKDKNDTLIKYTEDNKGDFFSAEYLSYTISVSEKAKGSQDEFDKAVLDAKAWAAQIAKATNPEEFAQKVLEYEESLKKDETTDTTSTKTETTAEENTEEETETDIQDVIDDLTETKYYETGTGLNQWMFETAETYDVYVDEETATETEKVTTSATTEAATEATTEAKAKEATTEGTSAVTTESTSETESETETSKSEETTTNNGVNTYEKFEITVYMLTKKADKDYKLTHNMTYLISDNKEAAEKFLSEFIASTDKTGDKFEELAQKQYDLLHGIDEDGDHNHGENESEPIFSFSQVERVKEKYFADDYDAINDWLDSEDRKKGDYTDKLIEIKIESGTGANKTTKVYYAAVLFQDHDLEAWHADALAGVVAEDIEKWYEEAKKEVTHNSNVIYGLVSQ